MVIVIFLWHIALIIDKMVYGASFCGIGAREILEIKAFLDQLLTTGKALSIRIQLCQDIMVAGQDAVDFPNYVDLFVCFLVVIAVAARVAAKLLVEATDERLTAV